MPEPNVAGFERVFFRNNGRTGGHSMNEAVLALQSVSISLRQSGCTDYEKPFVYLLFGKGQRALLVDTGFSSWKPGATFC